MQKDDVVRLFYVIVIVLFLMWNFPMNAHARLTDEDLTVELRIYVDGKKVLSRMEIAAIETRNEKERQKLREKGHIPIKKGESIQLKVEMIEKDGTVTDVTDSPYIYYQSSAPWRFTVSKTGLVTAKPEPGWELDESDFKRISLGSLIMTFNRGDKVGVNGLMFDVIE